MRKRLLPLTLALALFLSLAALPAGASMIPIPRNEDDTADQYTEDWMYWCQGASRYDNVREWGCRVVAQAKLLAESGIVTAPTDEFDPDAYFDWCRERGIFNENALELRVSQGPVRYAASLGRELAFLGKVELAEEIDDQCEQIMEKLNEGCYVILSGSSHQAYVSREASLRAGTPILYDSWKGWSYNPATIVEYRDYRMATFADFRCFRVEDAPAPPVPPASSEPPEPSDAPEPSEPPVTEKDPVVRPSFSDVPADAWYAEAVSWAVEQNVTQGTGNGKFSPEQNCTQAEIITFLWRAAGEPEPAAAVSGTEYYVKAVQWAKEQKIIDGSFVPLQKCSRKTAVTYMWKYAGSPTDAPTASFKDVPAGSDFARAVNWALQEGVTKGSGDGSTFSPADICDRGQIVTFLFRAFGE